MILHNDRPEDLETPLRYFDSYLTPNDVFFVRQHLPRPAAIDAAQYRLTVNGMVSKPVELTLADLQKLPQHTLPAVIECTGNGRGVLHVRKFRESNGAAAPIGQAEWTGPRIADVLKLAGASRIRRVSRDRRRRSRGRRYAGFRAVAADEEGDASGDAPRPQDERPAAARYPRRAGAPDRAGLGWHELGEVGGAALGGRAAERRVFHEPGLSLSEVRAAARLRAEARRSWK